jgi:hypothetical protein
MSKLLDGLQEMCTEYFGTRPCYVGPDWVDEPCMNVFSPAEVCWYQPELFQFQYWDECDRLLTIPYADQEDLIIKILKVCYELQVELVDGDEMYLFHADASGPYTILPNVEFIKCLSE